MLPLQSRLSQGKAKLSMETAARCSPLQFMKDLPVAQIEAPAGASQ